MPPSCALLGRFAIGARVVLPWQHNANRSYELAFVSDIAVSVLKSDVKLQPTNKLASTLRYDNIVRTRNVSECSVLALCLVTFCVSRRRRKMYCGHARPCVCVCVSVGGRTPTLLHGPGCNLGRGRGRPLVVHYWADLQSVHWLRCYGNITRTLFYAGCARVAD